MDEKQERAAFEVDLAEHRVRERMAHRDQKRAELANAEREVEYALSDLREKRKASTNIKSEESK